MINCNTSLNHNSITSMIFLPYLGALKRNEEQSPYACEFITLPLYTVHTNNIT